MDLDSDAFTDDLIIAATRNVAQAVIAFSNVDQHSMEVVVKGYLGGDDRTAIQIYLGEMQQNLDAISQQLAAQPEMQPVLLSHQRAAGALLAHGRNADPERGKNHRYRLRRCTRPARR